jgi:hypothetical protein
VSAEKRTFLFALMGLLVWSSVATITAIYYYTQYVDSRKSFEKLQNLVMHANVMIDYGNGTSRWHNETIVAGSTAFDALLAATKKVEFKSYPVGVYVTSIDGVSEVVLSSKSGHSWLWYYWNATSSSWASVGKAADVYILQPGDSTAWRYESWSF